MLGNTVILQSYSPFKGAHVRADLVVDMTDAPDPYCEAELEHMDGTDREVQRYVFQLREEQRMFESLIEELEFGPRHYRIVAAFCVGGHHRSVSLIEKLSKALNERGVQTVVMHRELERESAVRKAAQQNRKRALSVHAAKVKK